MASRGAVKDHPDGAPPGAEATAGGKKYAFDADGRAKAREDAAITIGEQTFHRRRKNWEVTRELRRLLRQQEKAGARAERLRARIDALTEKVRGIRNFETGEWTKPPLTDEAEIAAIEDEVDALDSQVDDASTEADEAAYQIIALLLRDDSGANPDVEHLKGSLDVEDAGDLSVSLAGGGETDPTPETASS